MPEESINLDDLDDINEAGPAGDSFADSAIIRCGRYMRGKAINANTDNLAILGSTGSSVALLEDDLLPQQREYIDFVATGMTSISACNMLGIDIFLPTLWEATANKDGTYMQCMNILKRKQADLLEENVWDQAMNNPKSTILKMFALKARKDEYKDNAAPMTAVQTNIHVSIVGKDGIRVPFTVDTKIVSAGDSSNGQE